MSFLNCSYCLSTVYKRGRTHVTIREEVILVPCLRMVTIQVTCFGTQSCYSTQGTHAHTGWTPADAGVRPNSSYAELNLGSQRGSSRVGAPSYPGVAYCNRKRFHPGRGCWVSGKGINAATSPAYWRARIS
jgi:hypothetical protein